MFARLALRSRDASCRLCWCQQWSRTCNHECFVREQTRAQAASRVGGKAGRSPVMASCWSSCDVEDRRWLVAWCGRLPYWPSSFLRQIEQLLELLTTEILHPDSQAPSGVKSHFLEIFLEELSKVGAAEVRAGGCGWRLSPSPCARTRD